ncbi:aspartate aminotransferase, cytoplasmic-like [Drosophila busckii]|uniref:aspartate aminotransferase, cytoplasmic-like n=1 Tax=Drosophila busckii TaxID=30019 RepID=UPI00083F47CD|nr:aspartate aminotransferase, cytoplasmic-like [Drosophila busckii]
MIESIFSGLTTIDPPETFALMKAFADDQHPEKLFLAIGAYRDDSGKPWVLPVVRKTEIQVAGDTALDHEYLPLFGYPHFTTAVMELALGKSSKAIQQNRAVSVQTISCTGSLRLVADLLHQKMKRNIVYFSNPTWHYHASIFRAAGFTSIHDYRYWDPENRCLDISGMLADLEQAPASSIIVLHACGHNPSGMDPTKEQWMQIADLMEEKNLVPLFDFAYHGFVSGDPDLDAWAVRYFVDKGFELFVCQSFSKNFGLYGERVGNLIIVQQSSTTSDALLSQLTPLIVTKHLTPGAYGPRIVAKILNTPTFREEWMENLTTMATRIRKMRQLLHDKLVTLGTPGNWDHIVQQVGMFSYTGLTKNQVSILVQKYHVYMPKSGRMNMCGLTLANIDYVAQAINGAVIADVA